jgi:hypothetical protein
LSLSSPRGPVACGRVAPAVESERGRGMAPGGPRRAPRESPLFPGEDHALQLGPSRSLVPVLPPRVAPTSALCTRAAIVWQWERFRSKSGAQRGGNASVPLGPMVVRRARSHLRPFCARQHLPSDLSLHFRRRKYVSSTPIVTFRIIGNTGDYNNVCTADCTSLIPSV